MIVGIKEALAGWFGGKADPIPQPSGRAAIAEKPAQMGFMDGADGKRSMTWTNTNYSGWSHGYPGRHVGVMPGSDPSRERALVSAIASDMVTTDSTISGMVENFATQAVGNGLTLSAKPDYAELGISQEEARKLSDVIERRWRRWSANPLECDATGRHTLHQLVLAAYRSYLVTGEAVVLLPGQPVNGAVTATKVQLLNSNQVDQRVTRQSEAGNVVRGVAFDRSGRIQGYYLTPYDPAAPYLMGNSRFVPAFTDWGRPCVLHLFDPIAPAQVRGVSPLVASLTPAKTQSMLREYTVDKALIETMFAASVKSARPDALKPLNANGTAEDIADDTATKQMSGPDEWHAAHDPYYKARQISLNPGQVNHLLPGDELEIHRGDTPGDNFDSFDKSLSRQSAKAAGASYEEASGDFSQTNFSASRLALDLPARINERRRDAIVSRIYQAVYRCWLEEMFETGAIVAPKSAPAFWEAVDAYTNAKWRGKGKAVADPLKEHQAQVLALQYGIRTYDDVLGEYGTDLEETLEQRAAEKRLIESYGLHYPVPKNRDAGESEEDTASKP